MKCKYLVLLLFTLFVGAICAKDNSTSRAKDKPIALTQKEFLEKVYNYKDNPSNWVYEGDRPCIIDFWAAWCGPCTRIAPLLEDLAAEYTGQIYIYKVNIDSAPELAQLFNVKSIPMLLFIPMNGKPSVSVGAMPKSTIKKGIDTILLNDKKKK